jgi:hypothetical protein
MLEKTTTESWNENYGKCLFFMENEKQRDKQTDFISVATCLYENWKSGIDKFLQFSFANKKFALHFAVFRRPTNTNLTIHLFREKIWILIWISLFSIHFANLDFTQIFHEVRLRQLKNFTRNKLNLFKVLKQILRHFNNFTRNKLNLF